ncbi:MAG: type II toxin-antitoxin system RelE/ParE family toxin [Pseudolabrys sp.]
MSRALVIEPKAEAEIAEALNWYDQRSEAARAGFERALEHALMQIRDNPLQFQRVYRQTRRVLVGHYPYALIYAVNEQEILIIACFHGRRDPRRWRERALR